MTGNLGRNQAQALQPILRAKQQQQQQIINEWCRPRRTAHMQSQA